MLYEVITLGVGRGTTPAADEGIKRIPVGPAQFLERRAGPGLVTLAVSRGADQAPVRGSKLSRTGQVFHAAALNWYSYNFV